MMSKYQNILKNEVPNIGYADCSMIDFARAIKMRIQAEMEKDQPDGGLIALLQNAACIGWELIEKSRQYLDLKLEVGDGDKKADNR